MALSIGWLAAKNRKNIKKHGLSFDVAARVFEDPNHRSVQDREVEGEERWQTVGVIAGVAVVLVAHTVEANGIDEHIHIISARKATQAERSEYEAEIS